MTPEHSPALLDVNVLVALAWPNHEHHQAAHRWFTRRHRSGWATTPVTESGFVRVSSNRAVLATAATPAVALEVLRDLTLIDGHRFLPDTVELVTSDVIDPAALTSHRHITDAHLLAVAHAHKGTLITFDQGMGQLLADGHAGVLETLSASR